MADVTAFDLPCMVAQSVWIDRSSKHECEARATQDVGVLECQDTEKYVPLYNRACISALSSQGPDCSDGYTSIKPEEASRCFNCGSYSHSLSNCPRPGDVSAINNSRRIYLEKVRSFVRPGTSPRYHQDSPGGKFDDLKPGILRSETRKLLGIGELDPPPWLNRMRTLGYPPGYFEEADEESSGVKIIDGDIQSVASELMIEEGNLLEKSRTVVDKPSTGKRMVVEFPGINSPIPDHADKKRWIALSENGPEQLARVSKRFFDQISKV